MTITEELNGLKWVMKMQADYLRKDPITKSINRHINKIRGVR